MRWGNNRKKSGVYLITCTINGKSYVGASKDIAMRLSTHYTREARKGSAPLYRDMRKYGLEHFIWRVLEYCDRTSLLECEKKWYHKLNPEYNLVEPVANGMMFYQKEVKVLARKTMASAEFRKAKSAMYRTEKYRDIFSKIQDHRKKSVDMYSDDKYVMSFSSFMEAQRWLNQNTQFVGKNKASKIKAVCDGDRPSAFGYVWKYSKCND